MWEFDYKESWVPKSWCFWTVVWRLLRVPWTARRFNQSILKEISPKYSVEGLMRKLNLQSFGYLMWRTDSLVKTLMLGGTEGRKMTEDEMAGWHHWLDGRESGWTPGVGDGQGGLACCDSWGRKESDTTDRLIWSDLMLKLKLQYFGHRMQNKLTHWKRPRCWERLKAGGERDDRGKDGWMA